MNKEEKFKLNVGVAKTVNRPFLENILSELKANNIELQLSDNLNDKFIIEGLITKEETQIVTDTFKKHGLWYSGHFPVS